MPPLDASHATTHDDGPVAAFKQILSSKQLLQIGAIYSLNESFFFASPARELTHFLEYILTRIANYSLQKNESGKVSIYFIFVCGQERKSAPLGRPLDWNFFYIRCLRVRRLSA